MAGFFIYYKYYAPGWLIIESKVGPVNIYVFGKEATGVEKFRTSLKPSEYSLLIDKKDYLPYMNVVTIKPMRITRIKAELTHMQDVGGLRIASAGYGVNLCQVPISLDTLSESLKINVF